jgi:hypothetical protein
MADESEKIKVHNKPNRCPYCHSGCSPDDENIVCNDCLARHHRECWEESGACVTCSSTNAMTVTPAIETAKKPARERSPVNAIDLRDVKAERAARIRSELSKGEKLLWVGEPQVTTMALKAMPQVLFGIPWTAFSLFWMIMAAGGVSKFNEVSANFNDSGAGLFGSIDLCFPLFGIPFVLVGFYLLTSPFWAMRKARATFYSLTDRRVILFESHLFGQISVRSYGPEKLGAMSRKEKSDGSGDIILDENRWRDGDGHQRTKQHGLMAIEKVRSVEKHIRQTLLDE